MGQVVVVTGPPGAGKSTVARLVAERLDRTALVPGDDFFGFLGPTLVPPWEPRAHEQNDVVLSAAAAAAGRLAAGGYTVVYDGVLTPHFLPVFLAAGGLSRLHYAVLLPSADRCVTRVRVRRGHGFTDLDATRHMVAEFADAGLDPRHVLVDPPDDPGQVAEVIVDRVPAGTMIHTAS